MSCSKVRGLSVGPKRFTGTPSASQRNLTRGSYTHGRGDRQLGILCLIV